MTDFNQKTHDTDVGSHGGQSRQMMEVFENQEFGSIRLLQEAGKMDLDVDVARLKVLKADHQSQQYRLEDKLMKYFPAEIEKTQGFIRGFQSDIQTVAAHPLPEEKLT